MSRFCYRISAFLLFSVFICCSLALAAPADNSVQQIRFTQSDERVRVVLDLNKIPQYEVSMEQKPLRLIVELPATKAEKVPAGISFNDIFVDNLQITTSGQGKIKICINLKQTIKPNIFTLKKPNRLVIDLGKIYEEKNEEEIRPGLNYISWLRSKPYGPVQAHILVVNPQKGFFLKPALSNGAVEGIDTLTSILAESRGVAAVNGSYFGTSGEIIGLLKIDGNIVSTPKLARTAMGIMPDGRVIIDQVAYRGEITLPDGTDLPINGVNRQRGSNELILYNSYYGPRTDTNTFGIEYVLATDGTVEQISTGNSPIERGQRVLSAHGDAVGALSILRVGDHVKIEETLGTLWDKALHILGAGPMLVKDGSVFLTTKTEEFGSDVAGGRAPRTAFGVTKDGKFLLVVVDGRQPTSAGLSLLDLAIFMQEIGSVEAMNFDGGGSSEMVINKDIILNKPSDGKERKMGNALIIGTTKLAN